MDSILPQLLAFPPHPPPQSPLSDSNYDERIRTQISVLKKISEKSLLQQTSGGESALDVINPGLNSVPYTYILLAHINAYNKSGNKAINVEVLWAKIQGYLENFDARQIRYIGADFSLIIDTAVKLTTNINQRHLALAPIRDALLRLNPSGSVLTSAHLHLVKVALETRQGNVIVPIIEKPVLYFPTSKDQPRLGYLCDLSLSPAAYVTISTGLTQKMRPIDIMEYFHYCAMILIGLRRWEDALDCLESVITYPAKDGGVSKVMTEAYKRWVLVSVLHAGKVLPLPKTTSSSAAKDFHVIGKPYEAVAQIFETGTASRLKTEVEYGFNICWNQDRNSGLMLAILNAHQRFQIRNLGKVYSKISIPEILNQTMSAETGARLNSPVEMEALVREMIQNGSLKATLSNTPGEVPVLTFDNKGPVLSEAQMQVELAAAAERITSVTQNIKQTDHMLTHEKDYIAHIKKQKASTGSKPGQDQGAAGAMEWNAMDEEEELMTGVF